MMECKLQICFGEGLLLVNGCCHKFRIIDLTSFVEIKSSKYFFQLSIIKIGDVVVIDKTLFDLVDGDDARISGVNRTKGISHGFEV